ncbi:MAG: aminomethyl-transferring glycine dehydrogenase [Myxococcota bacterium]
MSRSTDGGLPPTDAFVERHLGPSAADVERMLEAVGVPSLEALITQTIPDSIRNEDLAELPAPASEVSCTAELRERADHNEQFRSFLGMGYHDTHTPPVLLRNVLENPGWYTAYTPYQPEISQGRLEALLVFQTVITELTGMDLANASLLDEATAAAEAMTMSWRLTRQKGDTYFVDERVHPQVLGLIQTRAEPLGIHVVTGRVEDHDHEATPVFGVLVAYPHTDGTMEDLTAIVERAHAAHALVTATTDLLALTVFRPPGEMGVDIVVGSAQRFGVPLGYGGPHAGFMAARSDAARQLPGRMVGVSKDVHGNPALRLALQTREQHIRRQRATSNICTAQVLLAVMAGLYAVWHGPEGLVRIATRTRGMAKALADGVQAAGHKLGEGVFFDTVRIEVSDADAIIEKAKAHRINLRKLTDTVVCVALDETVDESDLEALFAIFGVSDTAAARLATVDPSVPQALARTTAFLQEPVFHAHRSETEMLRYLHRLQTRDIALDTSMIPLGSCTMKLNATTEMIPVTWPGFGSLHPFVPLDQAKGYARLFGELEAWLADITGFDAISLQPNAGSQGEYTGLLVIRAYHASQGDADKRTVCLIPTSAHGTNPASAVMAGMKVVPVACDDDGNIDVDDLKAKAEQHADALGALMVTYPSTHGVFETRIREICEIVHGYGGQVYMDGANMNAMVGLCKPGQFGADVCHLNLHKTFCIPHGGGGPGMGPIGVRAHLAPFLPSHPVVASQTSEQALGPVSAAPWGSPSILPISWAYIRMLGAEGLKRASQVAILNANYIATRLDGHYDVLYRGVNGRVAHECILDLRPFKAAGIQVEDVAKRLMDYGFHAPTMSWPVVGTLMVEPTESEGQAELDRFCDAMIAIRKEIRAIEEGAVALDDSPLKHAPHTAMDVTRDDWDRAYDRRTAAFPAPWTKLHKAWPSVGRIDQAYGDRNLICTCDAWPDEGSA